MNQEVRKTPEGVWQSYSPLWNEWFNCDPSMVALLESDVPPERRAEARTEMQRFLNSSPGAGRPSDAMRSVIGWMGFTVGANR